MLTFRTILHPTDFSECSDDALRAARALAGDGARLILLHVVPMESIYGGVMGVPTSPEVFEHALLDKLRKLPAPEFEASVKHLVREGDPATEIVRVADEEACDAIVIGSHGRSGLGRLLIGSVADAVLRKATCPVLVVKGAPTSKPAEAQPGPESTPEGKSVYIFNA